MKKAIRIYSDVNKILEETENPLLYMYVRIWTENFGCKECPCEGNYCRDSCGDCPETLYRFLLENDK